MSDRNSVRIQPSATAKDTRDHALRAARENDAGWDPTSRQATGWHGLLGFVSNYRSGEDPIYSPGHSYTHTEKICDGRTGKCDLNKINAEALIVPGATSTRPIDSGGIYQAKSPSRASYGAGRCRHHADRAAFVPQYDHTWTASL